MKTLSIIAKVLLLIVFAGSVFHWARCRFWVPRYIHYIAIGGFGFGILMILMNLGTINHTRYATYVIPLLFPVIVYISYGIYGGGFVTKEVKINELFIMDRAMDKDEVIAVLNDKMKPYRDLSYENLLISSINKNEETINGDVGNKYSFRVVINRRESEVAQEYLEVVGILTRIGSSFYMPKAHVTFWVGRNNAILKDGLSCLTTG